jgi:ribonuclease HI
MTEKNGLFVLYADGACRGNPGPMGAGAVVLDPEGAVARRVYFSRPWGTNNQAEYVAAIAALEAARDLGARRVELRMVSELVVRQLNGEYQVKNEGLQPLNERAQELLRGFDYWRCVHIRREGNWEADRLANRALDLAEQPATEGRRRRT